MTFKSAAACRCPFLRTSTENDSTGPIAGATSRTVRATMEVAVGTEISLRPSDTGCMGTVSSVSDLFHYSTVPTFDHLLPEC
jgi:hypothetical protein